MRRRASNLSDWDSPAFPQLGRQPRIEADMYPALRPEYEREKKDLNLAEKESRALKTTRALTSSLLSTPPSHDLLASPSRLAPRSPPTENGERGGGREGRAGARGVSCRMDSPQAAGSQ